MTEPALKLDETALKIKAYREDFVLFGCEIVKIKDHNTAKIVPLELNAGQKILHAVAEMQKGIMGYIRILLLKARRFGGSTYIEARYYWRTGYNQNRNAFIVGHEKESTNTLFEMAKLIHQQNPIPPQEIRNNEKSLKFDTPDGKGLKSEYRLATAENVDAGRSQGIHYLHGSEEAFWRDAGTLLSGLLQCIPDPPAESEVFRESTANGFGNTFQQDVFEAYCEGKHVYYKQDGHVYAWFNPESDWVLVFIPWYIHERYTKEFASDGDRVVFEKKIGQKVFNKEDSRWVDSVPLKLKNKYGLTLEQLHWREWAIRNKCKGSERIFQQEYPATVEEAFLSEGTNVFGYELCDQVEAQCEAPLVVGDIVERVGKTRIRANIHGKFKLWVKPDKDELYFLTVDSAGGKKKNIEKDSKDRKPDYTCIDVWNHRSGVHCAQWHGHIEYDLIADMVILIGNMFFKCRACVELQNHGFTVVAMLKQANYPMYENKPGEFGWLTNVKTKPVMIDTLYQMVRDAGIQIRCKETVSEMRTYIEENGHYEAATGCKDDRVMSAAMASQMMTLLPKAVRVKDGEKPFTGFSNWQNKTKPKREGEYREVYVS